ncbi:hypothetical protein ABC347_10875 [Sphingomonas sp. 1P06PA]|uniref:hypothetical protein n=1 Tax=Sphingomonas sp. 1P06PA TaxID=554121 RepID=UPI0039A50B75
MDLATYEPTRVEIAALFGKSERWIGELRSRGALPADGATLAEVVEAWTDHLLEKDRTTGDLEAERTRLTAAQADAVELKNAVTRRELFPINLYIQAFAAATASFKTAARALPVAMATDLATISDPLEVQTRLGDEIDAALEAMSETDFAAVFEDAGIGDASRGFDTEAAAEAESERME